MPRCTSNSASSEQLSGSKYSKYSDSPFPPFIAAAKAGDLSCMLSLLGDQEEASIADYINQRSEGGWTALNIAAAHGREEVVEALIERGANPLILTDNKNALEFAFERVHLGITQRCLYLGLKLHVKLSQKFMRLSEQKKFEFSQSINRSRILCLLKLLYSKFIYLDVETIFEIIETMLSNEPLSADCFDINADDPFFDLQYPGAQFGAGGEGSPLPGNVFGGGGAPAPFQGFGFGVGGGPAVAPAPFQGFGFGVGGGPAAVPASFPSHDKVFGFGFGGGPAAAPAPFQGQGKGFGFGFEGGPAVAPEYQGKSTASGAPKVADQKFTFGGLAVSPASVQGQGQVQNVSSKAGTPKGQDQDFGFGGGLVEDQALGIYGDTISPIGNDLSNSVENGKLSHEPVTGSNSAQETGESDSHTKEESPSHLDDNQKKK